MTHGTMYLKIIFISLKLFILLEIGVSFLDYKERLFVYLLNIWAINVNLVIVEAYDCMSVISQVHNFIHSPSNCVFIYLFVHEIIDDHQCAFRRSVSTVDNTFSICQIIVKKCNTCRYNETL